MARTVPERWVNGVIRFTVPMDISPESSREEMADAAVALFDERPDYGQDAVAEISFEIAEG